MNSTTNVSRLLSIIILLCISNLAVLSQRRTKAYEDYIDKHKDLAIHAMANHKIPASITLAQGLLESGAGNSMLSRKGNNHFGIKCHEWEGGKVYKDDDFKNECFRKYKKTEESYRDHSLFLVERQRYSSLFTLKITDYRGWAKGLQKAGYATDKAYANKLIKIIEDYELYEYDKEHSKSGKKKDKAKDRVPAHNSKPMQALGSHTPLKAHNLVYIIARDGDNYEAIANEFGLKIKDLCKYNEVPEDFPLKGGDLVYFQNKRNKASKPNYEYVVEVGDSMHSISQKYALRVKDLYKMNKKDNEYVPTEGDILRLR